MKEDVGVIYFPRTDKVKRAYGVDEKGHTKKEDLKDLGLEKYK